MKAPSSSGLPRLPRDFSPSSRPQNNASTTEYHSGILATSHEANVRPPHACMHLPPNGVPSFWNSYSPNMPLLFGPQGDLAHAPVQREIDNAPLVPSEPERQPKPQGTLLVHDKVVHVPETQMRIHCLSKREQAIVSTDGGNTAESQRHVLEAIERYPPDHNNQRVWTEARILLSSGKETIEYRCKAQDCDYRDVKFQKARQHFVSCHVVEACWGCPIEGCTHVGKYKRLDDLKHHHMVPSHGVEYTRNRKRDTSEHPTNASTAGQAAPHPTNLTSPLPEGRAPTVTTITTPSQVQDQGSASLHTSSQAERAPKRARQARQNLSAGPSQLSRNRLGRAVGASETTSGRGREILAGTEASSSNTLYQDATSLGVAPPANMYTDALSPQSHSQQRSPWSNNSLSPAYVGTSLVGSPYSPETLGSTYVQSSYSPLGHLLDGISAYVPQRSAYGEPAMPTAPKQGSYVHPSMPYAPSPLLGHPNHHGMASAHRPLTLSPQGDVDVGAPLRGRVTDGFYLSRQDRSNIQVNRVQDDLRFGRGSNLTSPATQSLVPSPHYNQYQWEQTGAGLPTNYPYNLSNQLPFPTNVAPATSSSAYIAPSQPPSRISGALSSDRSNGRDQALFSVPHALTHGFAESGGYLSAQWSGSQSAGVASPTQSTMYHNQMQVPRESMMTYQVLGFDGFETPNPDFGWSPHSGNPQITLCANTLTNDSFDSYPQTAWTGSLNF